MASTVITAPGASLPRPVGDCTAGPDRTAARPAGRYLDQFDLYRVLACAAVLGTHAFLWTVQGGDVVPWGFVMLLHFSRNSFFFLAALVVTYAQVTRPRSVWGFWRRRIVQIGVPYVVWTAVYVAFTLVDSPGPTGSVWSLLRHDLAFGYYQLYFVVVLAQLYLVLPLGLWLLRKTRRHGLVLLASGALALLLVIDLHDPGSLGALSHVTHQVGAVWPWSRDLLTYQFFVVAGVLAAIHLDRVLELAERHRRRLLATGAIAGVLAVGWYVRTVWSGQTTGRASDPYQPATLAWSVAVIAALVALGCWWEQRSGGQGRSPSRRRLVPRLSVAALAELTAGIYFSHVLFINLVRQGMGASGLRPHLDWWQATAVLYVATLAVSAGFVALAQRTPLARALTGPSRSEQRARVNRAMLPGGRPVGLSSSRAPTSRGSRRAPAPAAPRWRRAGRRRRCRRG